MLWLSEDEVHFMTGFIQHEKQCAALNEMGIKFKRRPADGFPLVERCLFDGSLTMQPKKREPNFAALKRAG